MDKIFNPPLHGRVAMSLWRSQAEKESVYVCTPESGASRNSHREDRISSIIFPLCHYHLTLNITCSQQPTIGLLIIIPSAIVKSHDKRAHSSVYAYTCICVHHGLYVYNFVLW